MYLTTRVRRQLRDHYPALRDDHTHHDVFKSRWSCGRTVGASGREAVVEHITHAIPSGLLNL